MDCRREGACGPDQFPCARSPGDCIPLKWRCDSTVDCHDGSDEADCPPCDSDKFSCQPGQCIGRLLQILSFLLFFIQKWKKNISIDHGNQNLNFIIFLSI